MPLPRREFLKISSAAMAAGLSTTALAGSGRPKALAFDAFPVFDPRPAFALCEPLFPGKGTELANLWRTRQFEYQWLRALTGRYVDFLQATEDALVYACETLKLPLDADKRAKLVGAFLELKPWPDAPAALRALKAAGLRLIFLSNATPRMLEAGMRNAGIQDLFEQAVSTDRIASYKPDPRAYRLGTEALGLAREEILFVAFAGWDAAGAKSFGYPTFWVNRMSLPAEQLGAPADASGQNLNDLLAYLKVATAVGT